MNEQMYGVVLWADKSVNKAVIWCEDHGNLAYYNETGHSMHDGCALDPGDLIQFDIREESECRRARNLRRVGEGYAPDLPHKLRASGGETPPNATVVPFRRK